MMMFGTMYSRYSYSGLLSKGRRRNGVLGNVSKGVRGSVKMILAIALFHAITVQGMNEEQATEIDTSVIKERKENEDQSGKQIVEAKGEVWDWGGAKTYTSCSGDHIFLNPKDPIWVLAYQIPDGQRMYRKAEIIDYKKKKIKFLDGDQKVHEYKDDDWTKDISFWKQEPNLVLSEEEVKKIPETIAGFKKAEEEAKARDKAKADKRRSKKSKSKKTEQVSSCAVHSAASLPNVVVIAPTEPLSAEGTDMQKELTGMETLLGTQNGSPSTQVPGSMEQVPPVTVQQPSVTTPVPNGSSQPNSPRQMKGSFHLSEAGQDGAKETSSPGSPTHNHKDSIHSETGTPTGPSPKSRDPTGSANRQSMSDLALAIEQAPGSSKGSVGTSGAVASVGTLSMDSAGQETDKNSGAPVQKPNSPHNSQSPTKRGPVPPSTPSDLASSSGEPADECRVCEQCKGCKKKHGRGEECELTTAEGEPVPRCYCIAKWKFGIFNMGLGVTSGLTAGTLAVLVGTKTIDLGSVSGDVNGAYLFLICFLIIAVVTGISGACFYGRNDNNHGRNLLIAAASFTVLSIAAGVTAGYVQVGTVAVNNLNLGWVMVAGFSALAITAFIWGYCCYKNKRICSTGMKAYC